MAPSVRDGAQWDGSCCALKLIKLAAGNFDAERVLESAQPSWIIAGSSPTASENNKPTNGVSSVDTNRSQWSRPWRESRCCRTPRWESSGPVSPRRAPGAPALAADPNSHLSPKRKVLVDMSSAIMSSTMTPGCTTKYFGLVGGELAVMSKVDPLGPRPASPDLWCQHADGAGGTVHAGGGLRSTPQNNSSPGTSRVGSRNGTRNRRGEVFTAEEPLVPKPVDGPEPPAWLESRFGLLRESSEGGGPSAASLASVGACHGGSTTALEWTSLGVRVIDSESCSPTGSSGGGVMSDGDDESSAFALSVTSVPSAVSDDEASEGAEAMNFMPIKGARHRQAAKVMRATPKPALRKKARYRRRKRGRLQARSGGGGGEATVVPTAQPSSKSVVAPVPEWSQREPERDAAPNPIDNINSGNVVRKPEPEVYDVWIPQRVFQGKGLPTLKRMMGGAEPQPQRSPRSRATQAAAEDKVEGDTLTANPPNQGVDSPSSRDCHQLAPRQQQRKQVQATDKRCAVHHVSGPNEFETDNAVPPPQASVRAEYPGDGTTPARPADSERPVVFFAGVTHDTKNNETEAKAKHRSGDGDDASYWSDDWSDDSRGGRSVLMDDAAAAVLDDGGGGSIVGWQQEGQETEQDDDEYFDFAKRFSWRTAAEVVTQAEAEAEAWSKEERRRRQRARGDERQDRGVTADGADEQLQQEARQQTSAMAAAAAAALRARERSDNAALVAVGRLRAPQSVFNPLHRTPSRPEMRRSITHGRFSPVGRKLWRQSEGLSPRTGQLCLSPRRRILGGEVNGAGIGSSSGGEQVDVVDWDEVRPSLTAHQQDSQLGLLDTAVGEDRNDRSEGSSDESFADMPPTSGRSAEEKLRIENNADLNRKNGGERGGGVHGEEGTRVGAAAAAATATAEAQGDDGAMPTTHRGHGEGVPYGADAGASDRCVRAARPDTRDVQAGWAAVASNGPRPPCSTATRCRPYTVTLPWDGHKLASVAQWNEPPFPV